MAITWEQYNAFQDADFNALNAVAGKISARLERFRENRFAAGLPFSGRLAEAYRQMMEALNTLTAGELDDESIKKQKEALATLNNFGGFLNLNVGPGNRTLRDEITKNADDAVPLAEELEDLGKMLAVQTDDKCPPLFDYKRTNENKKQDPEDLSHLLGTDDPKGVYAGRETPYYKALEEIQSALGALLFDRVHGKYSLDNLQGKAQEIFEWESVMETARHGTDKASSFEYGVRINNREKRLTCELTRKQAQERLRDGFRDFLANKIKFNKETLTGEEWLLKVKPSCAKSLAAVKKLLDPKTMEEPRPGAETRSAAERIDTLMDPVKRGREPLTMKTLAGIFGVRMAVRAERNDLGALREARLTEAQQSCMARQLMENETFKKFYEENEAELNRLAMKRGHGGLLEEKFQAYLCGLPAGELPNDPALQRYLPTCRQRIEALQKQVEKATTSIGAVEAMAEIVVLRGMAQAHRGNKKSLEKPIPADASDSLRKSVEILREKTDFQQAAIANRRFATEGHGGQLVEKMREFENDPEKLKAVEAEKNGNTMRWLNRTTYKGQRNRMYAEAGLMLDALADGKEPDAAMRQKYRELCMGFFALKDCVAVNGRKLEEDVDWGLVNDKLEALRSKPRFGDANLRALSAEEMKQGVQSILDAANKQSFNLKTAFPEKVNAQGEPIRQSLSDLNAPQAGNH